MKQNVTGPLGMDHIAFIMNDRAAGIRASIYSNLLPFATPKALQLYSDFEEALYAAL